MGLAGLHPVDKANVVFCAGRVKSLRLQFLFEDTSDAALARWKSLRTATGHLPHRENCHHKFGLNRMCCETHTLRPDFF